METEKLKDGFYFVYYPKRDIISIIGLYIEPNQVIYFGESQKDTIEELYERIKKAEIKIIQRIPLPKI